MCLQWPEGNWWGQSVVCLPSPTHNHPLHATLLLANLLPSRQGDVVNAQHRLSERSGCFWSRFFRFWLWCYTVYTDSIWQNNNKKKHSQLRHLTIYHFSKALQCLVASHAHTLQIWTLWMHPLVFVFDGMREQQRAKCLEKIEWNVSWSQF